MGIPAAADADQPTDAMPFHGLEDVSGPRRDNVPGQRFSRRQQAQDGILSRNDLFHIGGNGRIAWHDHDPPGAQRAQGRIAQGGDLMPGASACLTSASHVWLASPRMPSFIASSSRFSARGVYHKVDMIGVRVLHDNR